MVDRRRRHQRSPIDDYAANTADLDMPLSDTAGFFDLQAGEPFKAPTNSDVFNVPQGAAAVLDEFNDHPLSLSLLPPGGGSRSERYAASTAATAS
jgi:hypothetical protein